MNNRIENDVTEVTASKSIAEAEVRTKYIQVGRHKKVFSIWRG